MTVLEVLFGEKPKIMAILKRILVKPGYNALYLSFISVISYQFELKLMFFLNLNKKFIKKIS